MNKRIIVIGAGPTGLGAAYRLNELEHSDFKLFEKEKYVGGLSASYHDKKGFIWDAGGHVIHSHFTYFDKVLKKTLKDEKYSHKRESFVWIFGRLIPYPLQNHIHFLPLTTFIECFLGLLKRPNNLKAKNFLGFINNNFGEGIAKRFMIPYNQKIWDYPLAKMDFGWIGEKVSTVSPVSALYNAIMRKKTKSWGPNSKFFYPKYGTGNLWEKLSKNLPKNKVVLSHEIIKIEPDKKLIHFSKGLEKYDILISTIPINLLIKKLITKPLWLEKEAKNLVYNTVFLTGIGVKKRIKNSICWIYFPQPDIPFYRTTYLSNYSPKMTPGPQYSSILTETTLVNQPDSKKVIAGLINSQIISREDVAKIVSIWTKKIEYAYPIPTLERDTTLEKIQNYLEKKSIFSRGRFGAWKYEISNMDHSFMQGVEVVDRILLNKNETVWSL